MKKFLRSALSFGLAVGLLATSFTVSASDALGEDCSARDTEVNRATVLSENVFWSTSKSDLRTEQYITYEPNDRVKPLVTWGDYLTERNTLSVAARELEDDGYRVVAGMNGDFFNMGNGLPIGIVISDGVVQSTDGGYAAIGFRRNGTAVLGKPKLKVSADLGYEVRDETGHTTQVERTIAAINKARVPTGGIYLYTDAFNAKQTTGSTESGVDVICEVKDGELAIGETLRLEVLEVIESDSRATVVPDGCIVLSANDKSSDYFTDALRIEEVGNIIKVKIDAADEEWEDVHTAMGALYTLVEDGKPVAGLPAGAGPRTAVGQKKNGNIIFYTIDGRQKGYSIGASMTQVADRMVELGCETVLGLDGGGSTMFTVTPPDQTKSMISNRPSEGRERAVTNQLFLVADNDATGNLHHFYVTADSDYVMAGSSTEVTATAIDSNYIPMEREYDLTSSDGKWDDDVLTLPKEDIDVTVVAEHSHKTGEMVIHSRIPDTLTIAADGKTTETLSVTPGSDVNLSAKAYANHLPLSSNPEDFTWTVEGNAIDIEEYTLKAVTPGTAKLTVSGGGMKKTIDVSVQRMALDTVEDFETSGLNGHFSDTGDATIVRSSKPDTVRRGHCSGVINYELNESGTATLGANLPLNPAYTRLNLWIYGDNSSNTLCLSTTDGNTETVTEASLLDFAGWREISVVLPEDTKSLTGIVIKGVPKIKVSSDGVEITTYGKPKGVIALDQMVSSYGSVIDVTVPAVTAQLEGTTFTGTVLDDMDGVLPREAVTALMDGRPTEMTYNESTGAVYVPVPEEITANHRLTILARDASGNIGRASCNIVPPEGETTEPVFADTKGYWAEDDVAYLYTQGITKGYQDGSFRPKNQITREEFAVMLFRYLGINGEAFESVDLPFADNSKIGDYAKTAIKALYTAGIINGSQRDGKLYFNPRSNLTRAQAAAMIGRTQEKGFTAAQLSFTDNAKIPSYAAFYVQTMVAQGVLGGFEDGSFRPNDVLSRGQMAKILYRSR